LKLWRQRVLSAAAFEWLTRERGHTVARPKNFRELIVWQKAMVLAKAVYEACRQMPKAESFDLRSQLRRSAISVPSNIAEGHGRLTDAQFRHFLGNARGSLCEAQTQIELAREFGWIHVGQVQKLMELSEEVARLLNGLIAVIGKPEGSQANSANTANRADSAQEDLQ
jgi:four helix bundle protein